ncbi:uncharacterized protein LOC128208485 [Mya arenaria]|uniref:uncharacterized protein LOC128208485 n=1 Tax=Mya arenaria TaxID=6604 RepID=UPI0022E910AE|nr:uncharacterized protein LOC128208485 [Mya arenaria]
MCEEISDEGIIFGTGLELAVPNIVASTTKAPQTGPTTTVTPNPPVTPTFTLTSSLWDSDMVQEVSVATLGEALVWKILGPSQYDLLPYNCIGYGGKEVGGANFIQLTDESGCTRSTKFIQTFSAVGGSRSTVKTTLLVFKFIAHDDVTLVCSVRICKAGSATCALNCDSRRRRRRRRHSRRRSLQPLRRASVVSHLRIVPSSAMRFGFSPALVTLACLLSRHAFV